MTLIVIDAQKAAQARDRAERARASRAKYEAKHPERKRHHGTEDNHNPKRPRYAEYSFVMWDGEAPKDTGYSLFGSSRGHEICKPHLTTEQCFDLLLEAAEEDPYCIHFIFGGRYDFDEICRQSMPWNRLTQLKDRGHVTWHGYTIKQAEGKFFTLKKGGVCVTVWEVFGWFHKSYIKALDDYNIGSEQDRSTIRGEKNRRSEFLWSEIADIRNYWKLELKLGPPLMEKIREICIQAGFNPRAWYGPSALALEALRKAHITDYFGDIPRAIKRASQYAYAGGRFEQPRGGILSPVYTADKNSAYMAAALELPCLAHGSWHTGRDFEPGKFALYHIRYRARIDPLDPGKLYPLFCRYSNGSVAWPHKVDGWYWAPEAELVKDDPDATFVESYVFDQECSHVPFAFVRDLFARRQVLQRMPESNPSRKAEKAFKWALASIYGQLARTVGYDRFRKMPPKYHCLEWAGYITSKCRAQMYQIAKACGDKVISIDTDSVTAMCPITVEEGPNLGQWKTESYDSGVFFQSGVYSYSNAGKWVESKARGVEEDKFTRRLPVSPENMISAIYDQRSIRMKGRTRYVSIRMALQHRFAAAGTWSDPANSTKLVFGGNGKRVHRANTCWTATADGRLRVCPSAESHVFVPRPEITRNDFKWGELPKSQPHLLPWVDNMGALPDKHLVADLLWIDPEQVDTEDREWLSSVLAS